MLEGKRDVSSFLKADAQQGYCFRFAESAPCNFIVVPRLDNTGPFLFALFVPDITFKSTLVRARCYFQQRKFSKFEDWIARNLFTDKQGKKNSIHRYVEIFPVFPVFFLYDVICFHHTNTTNTIKIDLLM